ncbi:MAG: M42 family metallopeptidase [Anaerolineales bacterium]
MILQTLSEAVGVSGDESAVRALIREAIAPHVDEMRVDAMGNLIALKKGTGAQPLTGLAVAHMDEVGFMVTGHDGSGYLIVESIGGIDDKLLPALRVWVGPERTPGVFLWKPIHKGRSQNIVTLENMRIDIGAGGKDAAASAAPIGTRVAFASEYLALSEKVARGKAFDDRAGCAELVEIVQGDPLPYDLYACFSVQEEVGLRGAKVLAESIQPDFALVLEVTACHEVPQDPDEPDMTTVTKLGHGPAINYMDRASIAHPGLLAHVVATAEAEGIPHQFRSPQFAGGTDAGSIHTSGAGVPALTISLPGRYIHSPHTLLSLEDYAHGKQLAHTALARMTPDILERTT